jgi:hypothetical protein
MINIEYVMQIVLCLIHVLCITATSLLIGFNNENTRAIIWAGITISLDILMTPIAFIILQNFRKGCALSSMKLWILLLDLAVMADLNGNVTFYLIIVRISLDLLFSLITIIYSLIVSYCHLSSEDDYTGLPV